MSSQTKARASTKHRVSGFALDYACCLSIKKGNSKSKTSSKTRHMERGD